MDFCKYKEDIFEHFNVGCKRKTIYRDKTENMKKCSLFCICLSEV